MPLINGRTNSRASWRSNVRCFRLFFIFFRSTSTRLIYLPECPGPRQVALYPSPDRGWNRYRCSKIRVALGLNSRAHQQDRRLFLFSISFLRSPPVQFFGGLHLYCVSRKLVAKTLLSFQRDISQNETLPHNFSLSTSKWLILVDPSGRVKSSRVVNSRCREHDRRSRDERKRKP